jgi:cytochrome P450
LHDVKGNTFKSNAYSSFKRFFGAEMSLTTVDHKAHAFRRRVNASALTTTAVKGLENRVTPHVDYLIQKLDQTVPRYGSVLEDTDPDWSDGHNMGERIAFCIADVMGDVTFSQHFNTQRQGENRHYVHDLPKGVAGIHLVGHMQSLFFCNLHRLIFKELIVGIGSLMALSRSFAHKRLEERAEGVVRSDIWQALLESSDPKTGRGFTDDELVSEASLFIM